MNNNQADNPLISEAAKSHINDLIKQGKAEYKIFDFVDTLDVNKYDIQNIRTSLFEIIEINDRQRLKQNHEINSTARSILKLKHSYTDVVFRTWVECLYAAEPDRKTMRLLYSDFASLVPTLSPEVSEKLLQLMPEFVKQYKQDAFELVSIASTNLSKLDSVEDKGIKYLDFLEKYLSTVSEKGLKGLLSLGLVLFRLPDANLLEEFEKKCSPKVLKDAEHAEKFLITCGATIHRIPMELQDKHLDLCMIAACQSFGSALFIASDIPKKLEQLGETAKAQFIDSFIQIVSKVGICTVGFCSGRLHKLFSLPALGEAEELVELICEIASKYGPTAAFDFIEKEQRLSKRLWSMASDRPVSVSILVCIILLSVLCVLAFIIIKKL